MSRFGVHTNKTLKRYNLKSIHESYDKRSNICGRVKNAIRYEIDELNDIRSEWINVR